MARDTTAATLRAAELKRARTHCPQGHEYNEVHTYVKKSGHRCCRTCMNEQHRDARAAEARARLATFVRTFGA